MVGAMVEDLGEDDSERHVMDLVVPGIGHDDAPVRIVGLGEERLPEGGAVLGRRLERVEAELTITEARQVLLDLPERLQESRGRAVGVTRRGRPVLAILPWEFYESLVETLDVLGDPEAVAALRSSLEDVRKGRLVTHERARKRLGR